MIGMCEIRLNYYLERILHTSLLECLRYVIFSQLVSVITGF